MSVDSYVSRWRVVLAFVMAANATPACGTDSAASPIAPPHVFYPGLVFDAARQTTVLFGGVADDGSYAGMWEWNGVAWRHRDIAGPPPRAGHGMAQG